jgi:O-antigen/teichoic acid export membrane protein
MARSRDAEPAVGPFLRALRYIALLQSLMIAPLVVWARPIVELLLGDGYHRSIPVIELLAVAVYLAGFGPLVSLSVNYLGAATRRVPLVLGAAALNVVIDVILIPRIGVSAGAIGTGAAYIVLVGGHLLICRRLLEIDLRPLAMTCARGLLAAAAMAGVLLIFGTHPPLGLAAAWLAVGIAVFAGVLVATGEVTRAELSALRRR